MQIELHKGVGDIVFGLTESEIISKLGQPNKVVSTDLDNRDLYYNELKLVLKIELENDQRLGWIEVHNTNATWNGVKPFQLAQNELLSHLSGLLGEQYELSDYNSFESYSFDNSWVELQYELGDLKCFNFGVLYDENEAPLWPTRNT